uniref:Interleukin-17N n=1 Tax=Oncorhynchus tshawytscha TaxID=74940 RepID=A0A8C8MHY0_ONCTS
MQQLQHLRLLLLCVLALRQCLCVPLGGQCVDESFCTSSLQEYHAQLVSLPNRLNERSVAAWNYVEKIDLNRVPPVLYEANCLESHSCTGLDSTLRLETIPITLRMPVLRKNPRCTSFSLEFEPINIACICATSRQSGFLTDRF